MSRPPKVLRHGEHTHDFYMPAAGQAESWAGKSTDAERPDGQVSGIVRRFKVSEPAHAKTFSFGLLRTAMPDAMEYSARFEGQGGLAPVALVIGMAMSVAAGFPAFEPLIAEVRRGDIAWFSWIARIIAVPGSLVVLGVMLVSVLRRELFAPTDEPTLFDRRHRKVYRLFRAVPPGWLKAFKPWPLICCEYDWDCIDAEHQARVVTSGSTVSRQHALLFIVRKSATDPTIIDSFQIGNPLIMGETTVAPVYEHIRRFMQGQGAHLPEGESLLVDPKPRAFLDTIGFRPPYLREYGRRWVDSLPFMLLLHVLFPIMVPLGLLWGFFHWLARKTAVQVQWPQEVLDAVGAPLGPEQLAQAQHEARKHQPAIEAALRAQEALAPTPPTRPRAREPGRGTAAAARSVVRTQAPLALLNHQHAGGALKLSYALQGRQRVRYVVVDAAQQVFKGELDPQGGATLEEVAAGEVSVAYFEADAAT